MDRRKELSLRLGLLIGHLLCSLSSSLMRIDTVTIGVPLWRAGVASTSKMTAVDNLIWVKAEMKILMIKKNQLSSIVGQALVMLLSQ